MCESLSITDSSRKNQPYSLDRGWWWIRCRLQKLHSHRQLGYTLCDMAYNGGDDPDALPAWVDCTLSQLFSLSTTYWEETCWNWTYSRHLEPDQVTFSPIAVLIFGHWRDFFQAAELLYQQEQRQQQQQQPQQRQEQPQHRQTSALQPRHTSLPTYPYRSNPNPSTYQNRPQPPISQQPQQRLPPAQPYNNNNSSLPPPNPSYNINPYQLLTTPPPQNYGGGAPPQVPHGRSPPLSRPPPTPAPARKSASDASLFPLFKAVDKNGTGQLSEKELRAALVNGDWTNFDPHTVKMMIRLFDVDKSGTIGFDEFW